jgi:23S rRNA (uracil1939-C5)-methyltransferase
MEVIPSSNVFEYRNKMEFSFSDRRWILPEQFQEGDHDEAPALGLHVPGTFYKVIDIDSCMLQKDTGNIIIREVRDFVKRSGIPVYGLKSHEGFWRFLALRYSTAFDEWMVNIVTSENRPDRLMPLVEILKDRVFNIKTIVNNIARRRAGVAVGEEETVLTGEGFIKERLEQYLFRISANSFFQTNTSGAEKLYSKVMEYAELTGVENVLDLYCGTGTIPVFLSGKAKKVTGMEIVESAVSDAKINCQLNSVTNCEFIPGDVKDTIPNLRENVDVLIVDPPRTGIHKDVLSVIMERAVEKIVYVSCNPSTLARDLEIMSEKYEILEIQPVDMFPHTYHIESVVKMIRR